MNYSGPFDANALSHSAASLNGDGFSFGLKPAFIQHHSSDAHVVIPDAHLLFSGNYTRIGSDLIIADADHKLVVGGYFKGDTRPTLMSTDGAALSGQIVEALTGHVHYAQAAAPAPAAQVIGHVLKMSGSASAIRNGVSIELHIGDAVQKGDVIQTGSDSSIGMTFIDGSAFGMTSNARMVLNEMIYDPNGSSNSSLMSLVQGTITFVAGQTAKNGNMRVDTPVATMGIRGTAVLVEIGADNGPTKFSVLVEPDGHTGSYNLYDKSTGQLIGTVSQAGQVTFVSVGGIGQPPSAVEQLKTMQDQQQEKALIQQVFQLYFPNYNPDNSNPKTQKFGSTSYNNLAEITFTTNNFNNQTFLTQIELRIAVTDPHTGVTTYQNRLFFNTKAIFSADAVFGDQAFTPTIQTFKFQDVVHINDPDIGNAPFYDIGVPFVAGTAVILSATSTTTAPSEQALKNLLTINQTTGQVSYDAHDFSFLDDGETVEYVIRVKATSGPDSANVEIHVTINGANDAPVFGAPVAVNFHEIGAPDVVPPPTGGGGVLQKDITLHFTDADFSETGGNYQVQVTDVHTTGSTDGFDAGTLQAKLLSFFSFASTAAVTKDTNSTDGEIHGTFSADDKAFDYLADGQQLVITYRVQLTEGDYPDQHYYQDFTVTITGSNDVPMITAGEESQADTIYELPGQTGGTGFDHNADDAIPSGAIHFTDADLTDRPTAAITAQDITYLSADGDSLTANLTQGQREAIEDALQLSVPAGAGANTNDGVVNWTYKLVDNVLDFLAEDETITLVSTVRISDGHGGFVDATVTINIVGGANDTPSISAISDVALNEQTDTAPLHQDIAVSFTDVDLSDTGHEASVQSVTATGVVPPSTPAGALTSGMLFGLLTAISAEKAQGGSSGSASFSFDAASNVFDYLADGETVVLTYTVGITDPHGATGTQTVKVTVTGTNDVPVFTSEDLAGSVTETDGTPAVNAVALTDSGTIKFTDVDLSDSHAVSATGAFVPENSGDVALGTLTAVLDSDIGHTTGLGGQVTWTYSVDPEKVEYLAQDEHLTETFTITIDDGTSTPITKTISVDIVGTNDAPVITVTNPATDTEGNTGVTDIALVAVADHVSITDVDVSDVHTPYVADTLAFDTDHSSGPAPSGGLLADLFTLNESDGTISYDRAAFDYLAAGEHVTATFTFDAASGPDSPQKSISITIDGQNDAPVIAVTNPAADTEGNTGVTDIAVVAVADHVSITDVDASDVHTPYVTDTLAFDAAHSSGPAPSGGLLADLFTLNEADGTISYDRAAFDYLGAGQHVTATFTFDAASGPDSGQQSISITIDGQNDAPVMNIDSVTPVEDQSGNGVMTVSGVTVSDVDAGSDTFIVTAHADHGSVATLDGHSLDPADGGFTGTFDEVTALFTDGAVYSPDQQNLSATDMVTLTVTDGHSSDTVNFIFKQFAPGGVTLDGTTGKDWILSSTGDDLMTGNGGGDNFVFAAQSGNDTITDFHAGTDHIVLNGYGAPFTDETSFGAWLNSQVDEVGGNSVIHLDANDTITLNGVAKASLTAHDFIIHPAGA